MPKRGKKYQDSVKEFDRTELFDVDQAMDLITKTAKAKFDETVEVHIRLGVDGRHADQQVRGAIVLPHGTGKTKKVLVFAKLRKWLRRSRVKTGSTLTLLSQHLI